MQLRESLPSNLIDVIPAMGIGMVVAEVGVVAELILDGTAMGIGMVIAEIGVVACWKHDQLDRKY
jgi:hypothetical protein